MCTSNIIYYNEENIPPAESNMVDDELKERVTIRLDKDVVRHFKGESGKRYQTRINQALRLVMEVQQGPTFKALEAKLQEEVRRQMMQKVPQRGNRYDEDDNLIVRS